MVLATLFILAAAIANSSATGPILIVVVALLGSGGLGYFLDRRSAQASRLANDAVNATTVFQASLDEERKRRNALEEDLKEAKKSLILAMSQTTTNSKMIDALHRRIENLEADLFNTIRDMNEIIRNMFISQDGDEEEELVERWRDIMISTKLAVIQSDNTVTIVFMSNECADLLGYDDPSELLGKPVQTVITDKDYPLFTHGLEAARRAESRAHTADPFRISMKSRSGEPVPVLLALGVHKETITLLIRNADPSESLSEPSTGPLVDFSRNPAQTD